MEMSKGSEDRMMVEFFVGVFFVGCALIAENHFSAEETWARSDGLMIEARKRMDAVEAAEGESHGTK